MAEPSSSKHPEVDRSSDRLRQSSRPRYMGQDAEGKHVFVDAAPGGLLEALADQSDVESAHVLAAVVRSILDAERTATDAELAAFVPLLTDALERVVGVAARLV
ncbi:hypothetical protein [Streptomyces sp. NPDC058424]|uniref:hypothetical protein n=1 Tax=Streptomyces sp. NPDC058424 TaxID=3346491 RepID=UPI00365CC50D